MDIVRSQYKILLFAVATITSCLVIVQLVSVYSKVSQDVKILTSENLSNGFLISTSTCRIPNFDIYDEEVMKLIDEDIPVTCENNKRILFDSNSTHVFLVKESTSNVSCCYTSFWRIDPNEFEDEKTSKHEVSDNCLQIKNSTKIYDEYIKVTCSVDGNEIYEDYFSFVPFVQPLSTNWYIKPFNIFILNFDSMSRFNFIRQLPKTYQYLKSIGVYDFKGLNIVEEDSLSSTISMLTGLTMNDLSKVCSYSSDYFDECPFIWKYFKENGFVTSFAEDQMQIGLFQNNYRGFKNQPTDYYWSFFDYVADKNIGNGLFHNVNLCLGGRYKYKIFIDYMHTFLTKLQKKNQLHFATFVTKTMSHESITLPRVTDDDYYLFFQDIYKKEYFENTVFFIVSNHGQKIGRIHNTHQGMLEDRLPLLLVRLPEWYEKKYNKIGENLRSNTEKLVTHFDIYETLKDLLYPYEIEYDGPVKNEQKAYSLFNKIPESRGCQSAEILDIWCSCIPGLPLYEGDELIKNISLKAVEHMNSLIENYTECSTLILTDILAARIEKYPDYILTGQNIFEDYVVHIKTQPSNAIYEITARRNYVMNSKLMVLKIIDINTSYRVGDKCSLRNSALKSYCFCK